MEKRVLDWISAQQPVLDKIIADAAEKFHNEHSQNSNFVYDSNQTSKELYNLGSGWDLCYDRPTIGFTYSLWYHGKRVNTFLRYFFKLIMGSLNEDKIEILDLGAGTGAVQWSVGVIYAALKDLNIKTPEISVINVDSSPFMLQFNESYSWTCFKEKYPCCAEINTIYRLNSWVNTSESKNTNVWLSASYLFDHSENAAEIAKEFENLVLKYAPSKLLLLSANQKRKYVDEVAEIIVKAGYQNHVDHTGNSLQVYSGNLAHVNALRDRLQNQVNYGFSGTPVWQIDSLYGRVLVKSQITLPIGIDQLDIYISAEKDRTKINLSPEQEKASHHTGTPTIIVGPAGCGKSVVLTQRIKNIVEQKGKEYDPEIRILLTTFNKDLVKHLGDWLEQILDSSRCSRKYDSWNGKRKDHCWFQFKESNHYNIYVYHFDILPTKIGGLNWVNISPNWEDFEAFHLRTLQNISDEYAIIKNINKKEQTKILDATFLMDEYQRIIYGQQCSTEKIYQKMERTGRGNNPTLRYNSPRRKIVWEILVRYLSYLNNNNLANFLMQRQRLLRKVKNKQISTLFDHILVDEIQDCTYADYLIFQGLFKPRHQQNFVIAGDLAQSIHLGSSVHFPTSGFDKIKLKGSFRLPFRISEAIKPLSVTINEKFRKKNSSGEIEIINPYKGSPPGARPIIVSAKNTEALVDKIKEIFTAYKIFNLDQVAIYERDRELSLELYKKGVNNSSEIILKTKGLEKACVLWSTRMNVDTKTDLDEFVYTILTRTTSILIIAICDKINKKFLEIIQSFDETRLIVWDQETLLELQKFRDGATPANEEDDADTMGDLEEKHKMKITLWTRFSSLSDVIL